MVKRHLLEIEIAVIVLLVFLLCLKFQKSAEKNERLTEGEHRVAEVSEDGVITTADGQVIFPTGYVSNPGGDTPTEAPTPTSKPLSETERRLAALSEEDRARYDAALTISVPSGIAFANVEQSLSIREKADGSSKQIGILYPRNMCIVDSVNGEWAKVSSGGVKGYCRASYLITGEEAVRYAKETAVCKATTKGNVNIRSSPTTKENNVVTSVGSGKTFTVLEAAVLSDDPDAPLFVKIENGNKVCYVAMGLVTVKYTWPEGKAYK